MDRELNTIVIASDHAGFEMKTHLIEYLSELSISVDDVGTDNTASVDYPDFAHKVASMIDNGSYETGVLLCGSANGVSMTANKYKNVRCAICWNEKIAQLAKRHNNANIIALPARFITSLQAKQILYSYLNSTFEQGRHLRRINKMVSTLSC